jgi:hypothetical protein
LTHTLPPQSNQQNADAHLSKSDRFGTSDLRDFEDVITGNGLNADVITGTGSSQHSTSSSPRNQIVDTGLLAMKYAPNSFVDLVSDERTNRAVLRWVKEWDNFVFGSKSTNNARNRDMSNPPPEDPRPEFKILLLAGPPGTGTSFLFYIHTYIQRYVHTDIHRDLHRYIHTDIHRDLHIYKHTYIHTERHACLFDVLL